jgi:NAD(P)-dependent dehydrogenase (short-subunit alcohol dehydrogenase family)
VLRADDPVVFGSASHSGRRRRATETTLALELAEHGIRVNAIGAGVSRWQRGTNSVWSSTLEEWLNGDHLLPLESTFRQGARTIVTRIESITTGVADAKLTSPAAQFPSYQMLDIADASDRH